MIARGRGRIEEEAGLWLRSGSCLSHLLGLHSGFKINKSEGLIVRRF